MPMTKKEMLSVPGAREAVKIICEWHQMACAMTGLKGKDEELAKAFAGILQVNPSEATFDTMLSCAQKLVDSPDVKNC